MPQGRSSKEKREPFSRPFRSEYKGHPTLMIPLQDNDEYGMGIGKRKARAIVKWIREIQEFAQEAD